MKACGRSCIEVLCVIFRLGSQWVMQISCCLYRYDEYPVFNWNGTCFNHMCQAYENVKIEDYSGKFPENSGAGKTRNEHLSHCLYEVYFCTYGFTFHMTGVQRSHFQRVFFRNIGVGVLWGCYLTRKNNQSHNCCANAMHSTERIGEVFQGNRIKRSISRKCARSCSNANYTALSSLKVTLIWRLRKEVLKTVSTRISFGTNFYFFADIAKCVFSLISISGGPFTSEISNWLLSLRFVI